MLIDWSSFLFRWQEEIIEVSSRYPSPLSRRAIKSRMSYHHQSMSEEELGQLETRIGRTLPPSYREYLKITGKLDFRDYIHPYVWPAEKVHWGNLHYGENFWNGEGEYLPPVVPDVSYGQTRKLSKADREPLQSALIVHLSNGTHYLLNPLANTAEGEWEAWSLSDYDHYVTIYSSFENMMQVLYTEFSERSKGCRFIPRTTSESSSADDKFVFPWEELLTLWSRILLKPGVREKFNYVEELEDKAMAILIASQWLGSPPVSETQLLELESRLGKRLPPSYRQFLLVTNGLAFHSSSLIKLWPIEQVQWIAQQEFLGLTDEEEEEPVNSLPDALYFDYANQHGEERWKFCNYRVAHLKATLEIGGFDGNDYYLLNPLVVTPEGEWEAWVWRHEGEMERYPSFWQMMHETYFFAIALFFP